MSRPNPFALSLCGRFVVEHQEGEIYPTVMSMEWAVARQKRAEALGAACEKDADEAWLNGQTDKAEIHRAQASVALTIAAEIADALNGATGSLSDRRAAA